MQVSKNLAKWAYAWNWAVDRKPYYHKNYTKWDEAKQPYPDSISLCPLFWRTFVVTPALILTGLFVGTLALVGLRDALVPISIALGAVATAFGIAWLASKIIPEGTADAIRNAVYDVGVAVSPVFKGVGKAVKTACPLFDVEK